MTEKEVVETLKQAIDLIEGQQAKINKLEKARQKQAYLLCNLKGQKYELMNRISTVKNEAYKEFADRIRQVIVLNNTHDGYLVHDIDYNCLMEDIDDVIKELVADNKGCEYCKGRAYTKKPLTVITRYGRRIELAFDYCPKCGRRIKPLDEDLLEERKENDML